MPKAAKTQAKAPKKAGRKPGRRTLLTARVRQRFIEAIQKGASYELAARAAGISERTFYNWKARAEAGERRFVQFVQELTRAEAEGAEKLLDSIIKAAEAQGGDWRAAAWLLERRFPDVYAKRQPAEAPQLPKAPAEGGAAGGPDGVRKVLEQIAARGA